MKQFFLAVFVMLSGLVASHAQQPSPTPLTTEHTIYVPFEKLEEVFENQGRGVFLPYREFLDLWNKVNLPAIVHPDQPPVEGVLAAAKYTGQVEGDTAVLQVNLQLEAFKEGWSTLSLGQGQTYAEIRSTAILKNDDQGSSILFPAKGKYTLDATFHERVTHDAGRSLLHLSLPHAAAAQFELVIPGHDLDFTLDAGCAFTTKEEGANTRLIVYFKDAANLQIAWQHRAVATTLQPLLFAAADSHVTISAGTVRTVTRVDYRILRAGVSQFSVLVPAEQQVLTVSGPDLREWKIENANGQQRVVATPNAAVRDNYSLEIATESPLASLPAKSALPVLTVENVERQNGSLAVTADAGLTAVVSDLLGLTQQNAANSTQESFSGSYRYLRMPFAASIAISEAKPVITVESQTVVTVEPETRRFEAVFNYQIRKAGIFETAIQLPAGFTEAEATGDAVESSSVAQNLLTVRFKSRSLGDLTFQVSGDAPRKTPDEALTVPIFTPQGVERHDARIALAVHTSLKASTQDPGDLRLDDVRNITAVPLKNPDATPLTLGFRYRLGATATKPATIAFEQRKPRVSVEVLATSDLRESLVHDTWQLAYNIEYAGVSELSFAVPKEIADDLQIDGANIQERQRSEEKDATGKPTGAIVWTIRLQDKVLGQTALALTLDLPQTKLRQGAAANIALPEIRPLNVFRETGQVAVIKAGNIEITKTDPTNLELIDPRELDGRLQRDGVFLAYKYATHPVALHLDLGKNLYLDVPQALVTHAVLTSVIAENRAETTEVIYWLRNNSQQFISVQLPPGGRMLSDAFVNGDPQQPSQRPGKNEVLIRLPAGGTSSEAFPVRFLYEVPSQKPDSGLWPRGSIQTQPPVLNDLEIVQTKWTLYLPGGFRYVQFGGPMRETAAPWGWDAFRRLSDLFVPQFGPQPRRIQGNAVSEPPPLPAAKAGGFDFQLPKEGIAVILRRMDAPAAITTHYRSKTYANIVEAMLFFAALYGGVRLINRDKMAKFRYALGVGIGSLIIAGAVAPRAAGMWTALYLGVLTALGLWIVAGVWRKLRALTQRRPIAPIVPPILPTTSTEA